MTRHYYPRAKQSCAYCGEPYDLSAMPGHLRACISNPDVAGRLRGIMLEHSENGCLMSPLRYEQLSAANDLPSRWTIQRRFENWSAFAEWCGLFTQRKRPYGAVSNARRDLPRISAIREEGVQGLPCYPAWRCIRAWNPKAHVYVPVLFQKVMAIR